MVAAFRPREISEFLRYAEDHPNDEIVKKAKKALEAAMRKDREQMIEHLELANANRELNERMTMLDQELAMAMKEASRQRKVGQYSRDDLEKVVLEERNLKRSVEDAFRVKMADELLRQEEAKVKDLEEKARRHRDYIRDLQTKVELGDEQIRKLLGEKGNLLSRQECAEFNAKTCRDFKDNISDLEAALETTKGKTTEASNDSNGSDEHDGLLTEEQCNERWEANKELLSRDNEALLSQVSGAEDALRRCRQACSENPQREAAYSNQPLHEQILELHELLERNSILIDTQQQLLMDKWALGGGPVTLEDVQTEYSKLRTEIRAKSNGSAAQLEDLQRVRTANQEVIGTLQKYEADLKRKAPRQVASAVTGTEAERIIALDKKRTGLHSQAVLRQTNGILRAELETIKEKFTETKEDRDALKEALRTQDGRSGGLGPKDHVENPELIRCLERNTEYERERSSLKKEIEVYEASAATAEGEIAVLQQVVHDKDAKIAFTKDSRETIKNELEAKVVALEEAKADRERQIQRYTRKIAELKNVDPGK
jgi:chromosome segregation ATPase